jgi:hypothetical protein
MLGYAEEAEIEVLHALRVRPRGCGDGVSHALPT